MCFWLGFMVGLCKYSIPKNKSSSTPWNLTGATRHCLYRILKPYHLYSFLEIAATHDIQAPYLEQPTLTGQSSKRKYTPTYREILSENHNGPRTYSSLCKIFARPKPNTAIRRFLALTSPRTRMCTSSSPGREYWDFFD